jgi:hypothetical protein
MRKVIKLQYIRGCLQRHTISLLWEVLLLLVMPRHACQPRRACCPSAVAAASSRPDRLHHHLCYSSSSSSPSLLPVSVPVPVPADASSQQLHSQLAKPWLPPPKPRKSRSVPARYSFGVGVESRAQRR